MNSSFAIWYEKKEKKKPPSIKLHINLWINDHKGRDIIDFGMMVSNPKSIKKLFFYIPFNIEDKNIELLTQLLVDNPSISNLVFNSNVNITVTESQIHPAKIDDKNIEFYTKGYNMCNSLENVDFKEGTLMEFTFDSSLNKVDKYIRFRIKDVLSASIVTRTQRAVSFISGVSNMLVAFEINMNQFRKLPKYINQKASTSFIDIERVDLFVMTNIQMNHSFSSIKDIKSRILEKRDWIVYNKQLHDNENNNILAYHFVTKAEHNTNTRDKYIKEFTIFNKFDYEEITKPYKAFLVIFLFGFIGSFIGNFFVRIDLTIILITTFLLTTTISILISSYFWLGMKKGKI